MKLPPHPARPSVSPPSPARGEGFEPGAESSDRVAVAELIAEGRNRKPKPRKLKFGHSGAAREPSPLAGEGGDARSATPGEGAPRRQKKQERVVGEQIAFARTLRVNATGPERKLWQILRQPPFSAAKFRRQVPIGPYVADFLSYSRRLVVELDGGQHADSLSDRRRDAWLRAQGFRVVRFWNADVLRNIDGVMTVPLDEFGRGERAT
jgi:very-short-patch-repair endonuclease